MAEPRCPLCGSPLTRRGKKWVCESCDRSFYVCPYCGEVFTDQRSYAPHMRSHKREKGFAYADRVMAAVRDIIGLELPGYKDLVSRLVERGFRPEESAIIALVLTLHETAAPGGLEKPPRPPREKNVNFNKKQNAHQDMRETRVVSDEGLPSFACDNPWLKALSRMGDGR